MEKIVFSYAGKDRMSKVAQLHSHRGYELLYIDSGHCVITFNNSQKLDGAQGDVFLIPPHIQHERYNLSECHTYYAVFECNSVEFMNMKNVWKIAAAGDGIVHKSFQMLPELNKIYDPIQAATLISFILLHLKWFDKKKKWKEALHPALQRTCDYITSNLHKTLSNDDIASVAAISVSHLFLLFHSAFGISPQRYLLEQRMTAARQLLLDPYYNISEGASQVGFSNIFYFSRCFKKYHGVSPSEYRGNPSHFADTESYCIRS